MLSVCGISDPAELTGPMITEAAAAGDPCAVELLDDLGRWLGEGLASIVTLTNASELSPRRLMNCEITVSVNGLPRKLSGVSWASAL